MVVSRTLAAERMRGLSHNREDDNALVDGQRMNFPVPREIRDQIFGYLLRHEFVEGPPYGELTKGRSNLSEEEKDRKRNLSNTFHFHTSILRVNSQIAEEALEIFESNDFVIVSHTDPRLPFIKHEYDLPVVTENHIASINCHTMRLHIEAPAQWMKGCEGKIYSFAMLAAHLPRFCQLIQVQYYTMNKGHRFVFRSRGKALHEYNSGQHRGEQWVFKTEIDLRSPGGRKSLNATKADALLKPFRDMISPCQKVAVSCCDTSAVNIPKLQIRMGPFVTWLNALAWHTLGTVQTMKQEADELVMNCDLFKAEKRYTVMSTVCRWDCFFSFFPRDDDFAASDVPLPVGLVARILLDACATLCFLRFRLKMDVRDVTEIMLRLEKFILHQPDEVSSRLVASKEWNVAHLGGKWVHALVKFLSSRTSWFLAELFTTTSKLLEIDADDEHLKHDNALAKNMLEQNPEDKSKEELMDLIAASALPVKIFHSPTLPACTKPPGLEGFVDTVHLEHVRAHDPNVADFLVLGEENILEDLRLL